LTILPYDLRAISGIAVQIDQGFLPLLRRMFCLSDHVLRASEYSDVHRAE
jgi:hypothetical protein